MRDSRLPRGTWTASGRCPSSHSSRSRTSTKTAPSRERAPRASTSSISARTRCSNSLYVGICRIERYRGRPAFPATVTRVAPRVRVLVTVAAAAAAAATAVVGITLATRQSPEQPQARKEKPPFVFDRPTPAEPEIKAAFRAWPDGTLDRMERLGDRYPRDAVVQFH